MKTKDIGNVMYGLSLLLGHEPDTVNTWYPPYLDVGIQTSNIRVTRNDVLNNILTNCRVGDDFSLIYNDATKKKVDPNYLDDFLVVDPTNEAKYVATKHDCDDFAKILLGKTLEWDSDLCIGTVTVLTNPDNTDGSGVGCHMLCAYVDVDNNLMALEPQTDKFIKFPTGWEVMNMNF
jgi:hypothetical protein